MGFYVDENGNVVDESKSVKETYTGKSLSSGALSFAKVFGWMFLFLAITALVSVGTAFLYTLLPSESGVFTEKSAMVIIGVTIASGLAALILNLVLTFVFLKGRHSILIPTILYSTAMGITFGILTLVVPLYILGIAFGGTALVFGFMALLAVLTKGKVGPVGLVGFSLLFGVIFMSLICMIVSFFVNSQTIIMLMWIISLVYLIALLFITMFDIANIKRITEDGEVSDNLSMYCAVVLYTDFIRIFIRLVILLLKIFARRSS